MRERLQEAKRWLDEVVARTHWLPSLVGRLVIGVVFAQSGWGKLHNLPKITAYFAELGIPHPELQAPFASGTELVCGLLLLLGLATRFAAIPLVFVMIVAILTAKLDDISGFADLLGQVETAYIAILLLLVFAGGGPLSLDALIARFLVKSPPPQSASGAAPPPRARRAANFASAGLAVVSAFVAIWWFGSSHNPCDKLGPNEFSDIVATSRSDSDDASDAKKTCRKIEGWKAQGKDPAAELKKESEAGDDDSP